MQASKQDIVVLATGGTIAGTGASARQTVGYSAAQLGAAQLLEGVPALRARALAVEQVAQIDSKDMTHALWLRLAQRCAHWLAQPGARGIVITHGTDTLEETAFFLQTVLAPAKPVVLVSAMRPATALGADGSRNLLDALTVACTPGAQGVVTVGAGVVHGARDVRKMHPHRLDAFGSGDAGALGRVEDDRLFLYRNWPQAQAGRAQFAIKNIAPPEHWPRVEIVMSHAGANGELVQLLLARGVEGIIAAGTGNGALHQELQAALLQAQTAGVRVRRATRCAEGRVLPATGDALPDCSDLTPVKARIALMLELMGL